MQGQGSPKSQPQADGSTDDEMPELLTCAKQTEHLEIDCADDALLVAILGEQGVSQGPRAPPQDTTAAVETFSFSAGPELSIEDPLLSSLAAAWESKHEQSSAKPEVHEIIAARPTSLLSAEPSRP